MLRRQAAQIATNAITQEIEIFLLFPSLSAISGHGCPEKPEARTDARRGRLRPHQCIYMGTIRKSIRRSRQRLIFVPPAVQSYLMLPPSAQNHSYPAKNSDYNKDLLL